MHRIAAPMRCFIRIGIGSGTLLSTLVLAGGCGINKAIIKTIPPAKPQAEQRNVSALKSAYPTATATADSELMPPKPKAGEDGTASARALPGQIIVDPDHPSWLVYNKDEDGNGKPDPFFMCGPGDPEGFLYRGSRNPDGTRRGDQMRLIGQLKGTGANCIYLMAVRSHGGDAGKDPSDLSDPKYQNPFTNGDPAQGLDPDILDQWETWFTAMEENGIVIYFFFYDDSARIWKTGDRVGRDEQAFLRSIVKRFQHHRLLIWCIAEEYGEKLSRRRTSNIAAVIRAADDHDHVIAVHQNNGLEFHFAADPNIDQFAVQYNVGGRALHDGVVEAWRKARGRFNLNMAESNQHGAGATARKNSWACAMAGAYVMILRLDIAGTAPNDLHDCGRLVRFFEATNFNEMAPHDALAYADTEYVLATPGESYIAYAADLSVAIGLKDLTPGRYSFTWFDCATGQTVNQHRVRVAAGNQSWRKPAGIGAEAAVYIQRLR